MGERFEVLIVVTDDLESFLENVLFEVISAGFAFGDGGADLGVGEDITEDALLDFTDVELEVVKEGSDAEVVEAAGGGLGEEGQQEEQEGDGFHIVIIRNWGSFEFKIQD